MKVVINCCYGGFSLSDEFIAKYPQFKEYDYSCDDSDRVDENFIKALEEFGLDEASGSCASLKIAEIPNDYTDWQISEYDGDESVIFVVNGKIHYAY